MLRLGQCPTSFYCCSRVFGWETRRLLGLLVTLARRCLLRNLGGFASSLWWSGENVASRGISLAPNFNGLHEQLTLSVRLSDSTAGSGKGPRAYAMLHGLHQLWHSVHAVSV